MGPRMLSHKINSNSPRVHGFRLAQLFQGTYVENLSEVPYPRCTRLKFNSSPVKMDGWKTSLSFWVAFQGRAVKLRGCTSSFCFPLGTSTSKKRNISNSDNSPLTFGGSNLSTVLGQGEGFSGKIFKKSQPKNTKISYFKKHQNQPATSNSAVQKITWFLLSKEATNRARKKNDPQTTNEP